MASTSSPLPSKAANESNPTVVFEWADPEPTGAVGWVVLDKIINGIAGGGIFMHSNATMQETADIARNMSRKFTVCDPQIGGAKAGIKFDHRDPEAKAVLRRFIIANGHLLRNVWVTAGDLNTDDAFIETVVQQDLGLPTCQGTLGRKFAEVTGQVDLSKNLAQILMHKANKYFPLIEGSVGYGLVAAMQEATRLTSFEGVPRVAIQGFGAVGSSAAYFMVTKGLGKVVALADAFGFISSDEGLPIEQLLEDRYNRVRDLQARCAAPQVIDTARKNMYLTDAIKSAYNYRPNTAPSALAYLDDFINCGVKVDVFCPCALRYVLTEHSAQHLVQTMGPRFIVSGANNPYGMMVGSSLQEDTKGKVLQYFEQEGITVVPDWVANSGTAQLFHRGLSVAFNLEDPDVAEQILEACAAPIRSYLNVAYLKFAHGNTVNLAKGCERLAGERLKHHRTFLHSVGREPYDAQIGTNPAKSRYALPPPTITKSLAEKNNILDHLVHHYGAECIDYAEICDLLATCPNPVAYDGFEPSGRMHLAQGLMKSNFVNALTQSGFTFIFWVADWFALLNHKMGGDLDKIQVVGKYMIEVWKASGMNMDRVRFLWASEEFSKHSDEYWARVLDISTKNTLNRITRCTQIMGRSDKGLSASQIFYPCMQAADIFFLGVDLCQLGLDQRKVNMLAREYAAAAALQKPSVLSHPMVPGLKRGQEKMSKSMPESSIFMEDTAEEVARKVKGAYCPSSADFLAEIDSKITPETPVVERIQIQNLANPVLAYFRLIVADSIRTPLQVGPTTFETFDALYQAYIEDKVHPVDLKAALIFYINQLLEPVRQHFMVDSYARSLREQVLTFSVSR
jgi:tyrosyl-tRNA synthetase